MIKYLNRHRFLFGSVLSLFVIGRVISFFINSHTVIQSGEYVYSLDYLSHFKNIYEKIEWGNRDYILACKECGRFYHYSWWYALVLFGIASIGEILHYNPFVFYLCISLTTQFVGLYLIRNFFFKKLSNLYLLLSFLVFSLAAYKISAYSSGSWYGFNHGILTIFLALMIFLLKELKSLEKKHLIVYGLFLGALGSLFSSISINFMPIVIYCVLLIAIYFLPQVIKYFKSAVILFSSSLITFVPGSLPFLTVLLKDHQVPSEYVYAGSSNNETLLNAFSVRSINLVNDHTYTLAMVMFGVITTAIFLVSSKKLRIKIFFILVYLIDVILLMGNKFLFNLYGWLFDHLPLLNTIRSSHRFYYFLLLVQAVLCLFVFEKLSQSKNKIVNYFFSGILSVLVIFITVKNVYYFNRIFAVGKIPDSYQQVTRFFHDKTGSVIYLPFFLQSSGSMIGNYSWLNKTEDIKKVSSYALPFSSIYLIRNQILPHTGEYPSNSYSLEKIKNLWALDFRNRKNEDISSGIDSINSDYLIFDKYFDWGKFGLSDNNILEILDRNKRFTLIQKFDDLYIYSVSKPTAGCIKYYGDFIYGSGYCLTTNNNVSLVNNKSVMDFVLDNILSIEGNNVKILKPLNNPNFSYSLTVSSVINQLLSKGIPYPEKITEMRYQGDNTVVFEHEIDADDEKIAIPVYTTSMQEIAPGDIEISYANKKDTIKTYTKCDGFKWFVYTVGGEKGLFRVIASQKNHYYMFGQPLLITKTAAPQVDSYISSLINNVEIRRSCNED